MTVVVQPVNCSLKIHAESSTDAMIRVMAEAFRKQGAEVAPTIRAAAHDIKPGVRSDEGPGDAWPDIRAKILAADILLLATPIWLGQPSSVAKRVMERMDAFLGEADERGRMPSWSKLAVCGIVGNEDGAHATASQIFQGLNDVGFTIPSVAACYWVGEAMGSTDFKDLHEVPAKVRETATMLAVNAVHLAELLGASPLPGNR